MGNINECGNVLLMYVTMESINEYGIFFLYVAHVLLMKGG
jgi:hypothetical protein